MLENSGYTVLAAPTGDIAEALLREHKCKIDLLVTDVVMPEINGIELALKLRAICPQLKVLFMSGYAANALGKQANFEQGSHFLQKPFSLEALTTKVREVLNTELQEPSA